MTPREKELEAALKASNDALLELMACASEILNSRIGRHLYEQCHRAVQTAGPLLPRGQPNYAAQRLDVSKINVW